MAGILVRAGDDSELTGKDLDQILRVLVAFNSTKRSADDALSVIDVSIGPKLLKALAFAAIKVDYANGKYQETPLALELRKLAGRASFASTFSASELAKLVEKGNAEVAGFLFAGGGIAYSKPMLELGFKRFVLRGGELNDKQTGFLLIDPPGFRVLAALASNPAGASGIMFDNKSVDQAWSDFKKLLDGPNRLSQRRKWNSGENKWKLEGGGQIDKETDLAAALFLSAATKGYAATHTAAGQGKYLYDILTKAITEQGKYKLTDGGRVALASLLNQTMAHPDYANKYIVTIASDSVIELPNLKGADLLEFIATLSKSRRAAEEVLAGFGLLLRWTDIVDPFQDYRNAKDAGGAFKRITRAVNEGLKERSDEEKAVAQKLALVAAVLVSLTTGGLGYGAGAIGTVAWAGAGDGLMTYISAIPADTFKEMTANSLVKFELQKRILQSTTPGIDQLKRDPLVSKYIKPDGTFLVPEPARLKQMMEDINGAFYKIDPANIQHSLYPGPQGILQEAMSGWESDPNK